MRRTYTGTFAILSVGFMIVLAGCSASSTPAPSSGAGGAKSALDGTQWLLGTVGGAPVVSGTNASLLFEGQQAGGFGGCNQFFASYTTDGSSKLTFGPIGATRKACDTATDAFETAYFSALASVAQYKLSSDALTLSDSGGKAVLEYSAAPAATVEGPWNVTGYNNGKQAVVSVSGDVSLSVAFGPDGHVEGFGGCNNFSGGYSVTGDSIAIGPLMSTMKACSDTIDAQEGEYLTALQAATKWQVQTGTLELRDNGGALQVTASSAIGH